MTKQNIFELALLKLCIAPRYASFGIFCAKIDQLFAVQWDFKHSEELWNQEHLSISKYTWKTHGLKILTDLGTKSAKRRVKMWNTNFCKTLFEIWWIILKVSLCKVLLVLYNVAWQNLDDWQGKPVWIINNGQSFPLINFLSFSVPKGK